MIARAPGKIVVSGAYSVLEGAPALVAAVDRYVEADGSRTTAIVTEEVLAAMSAGVLDRVPWFDASALRTKLPDGSSRKLGLGSSAAILVASLGAVIAEEVAEESALRRAALPVALDAHKKAQPLGSGIDVAASVHGGIVCCRVRPAGQVEVATFTLPAGLVLEVFACPTAASTAGLLEKVRALRERDHATYRRLIDAASNGARAATSAKDAEAFVSAISVQLDALAMLGRHAGAAIVIDDVAELRAFAEREQASFGPSGAGGGDIALWVGLAPPSSAFLEQAAARNLEPLGLKVGARGLHVA